MEQISGSSGRIATVVSLNRGPWACGSGLLGAVDASGWAWAYLVRLECAQQ